jgi:hypothetical protein
MQFLAKPFDIFARLIFAGASIALMVLAVVMIGDAMLEFMKVLRTDRNFSIAALTGISYVVVAIAVFDVAKYFFEEEVIRARELRVASETRRSLTRFISIVAIAIFLEALLTVFNAIQDKISDLIYPTLLLIAAILMVIGLGVFQRLSAIVEQQVDQRDRADAKQKAK